MTANRKILLATFGSLGDLNPFVALAHALKAAGFEPIIATSAAYEPWIREEGFGFAPIGPDVHEVMRRLNMDMGEIARRMTANDDFFFRELIFPFLRPAYDDLLAASKGAAAIVAHSIAFAAHAAAERRRLPLANVFLSPLFFMSAHDPPSGVKAAPFVRDPRSIPAIAYNQAVAWGWTRLFGLYAAPIRRLRREAGLPGCSGRALLTGGPSVAATIALVSPLLAPPQPDHPPNALIAGHTFHDRVATANERLGAELEAFIEAGPPPIVVTLGSFVAHDSFEFYRRSAAAAHRLGRRVVLLAADEQRASARAALSAAGAFVAGYVPHSRLFPRACAIVHHGGSGTTGQALRTGKPQLVVPFFADQPDNAARLVRLGVARRLAHGRYTEDRVARELEALLGDETYAARAKEVGALVAREDGAARAARAIADMLERNPVDRFGSRTPLPEGDCEVAG